MQPEKGCETNVVGGGGGVKDLLIIGLAVQVAAFYVYCYTGRVSL